MLVAISLIASVGVIVYVASWGFYLRAGRFIGLQLLVRIVNDGPQLWQFLVDAESADLVAFAIVALLILAGMVPLVVWLVRSTNSTRITRELVRIRRTIWVTLTVLVLIVFRFVVADPSDLRRVPRIASLKLRLNPVFTLVGTTIDRLAEERIEPCLDTASLNSRSRGCADSRPDGKRPPIIFIVIEAMRHDVVHLVHEGREVTPNLNALARLGLQMSRTYAQSTHTDYAEPCIVSSLYPVRATRHCYYQSSDRWPKTLIYDILKQAGYATALISSENLGWGAMDKFYQSPSLDLIYDAERSDEPTYVPDLDGGFVFETRTGPLRAGKLDDAVTTDHAIRWIQHQTARARPFFLFMDFQGSHFPYPLGANAARPFQPCELSSRVTFMEYPVEECNTVRNAYYNALHEADRQLGRLVETLRDLGILEHAILVVTGDHGELFHEHGRVTHAREPYEPVVRVPCVIHAPDYVAASVDDYPMQHIDLVPTVLTMIGQPSHPNFQGINVLASDRPPLAERLVYMHVENGLARVDAALWGGRWKLIHDRRTEYQALYDLASDPNESRNLIDSYVSIAAPMRHLLDTWRRRQLAYYHFPMYHLRFYPPDAPRISDVSSGRPTLPMAFNIEN